jgi:hypothetical protein
MNFDSTHSGCRHGREGAYGRHLISERSSQFQRFSLAAFHGFM